MIPFPFFTELKIPLGLLFYPLTFLLSDLVTELSGIRKAKQMVYLGFAVSILTFGAVQMAFSFFASSAFKQGTFYALFKLSELRIGCSLAAYLLAQLVDIQVYALIKRWTATRFLALRASGSSLVSQLVDTLVIDLLYFYFALGMELKAVIGIMLFSYLYKTFFSLISTPLLYFGLFLVKKSSKALESKDIH